MQTLSANRTLYARHRQASRCKGSEVEQASPCAPTVIAYDFLKHQFLPKYEIASQIPKRGNIENTYLNSLKRVKSFYNIETIDVRQFQYPYNILLSQWDAVRKLSTKGRFREILLEEDDEGQITLSVKETLNTGYDLYYIPIASLYRAMKNGEKEWSKLLFGVCVFLYRKAGVCHYRDSESYICYLYDIMDGWIEDDRGGMDDADYDELRSNLDEMLAIGDALVPMLSDERYLLQLQTIIQSFTPNDKFEKSCLELAKKTILTWMEYPCANIYLNIGEESEDEDDYYGTGKIRVTDYISFIGETTGDLYDAMKDLLNDDFNNRSGTQDFEATILFDKHRGKYQDQLGYEESVIAIISELCNLLTELP